MTKVKYEYDVVCESGTLRSGIKNREDARDFKRHWKNARKGVKIIQRVWTSEEREVR